MRLLLVVFICFVSSSAFALDWSQPISDQNNVPISACDSEHSDCGKVLTILGDVVSFALLAQTADEQLNMGAMALKTLKFKRMALSMKVKEDYSPTADEIIEIKKVVTQIYSPFVAKKVFQVIGQSTMSAPESPTGFVSSPHSH